MRRRENPYQGDVYTIPLISREQNRDLLSLLEEGVVYSGEAEYARNKVLVPLIDDLRLTLEKLETRRVLQDTGDPMTPFADDRFQAEYSLMEVILIMLNLLNIRIEDDPEVIRDRARGSDEGARRLAELLAKDNPRRRRRLKRY